jgi:hypothetical protein
MRALLGNAAYLCKVVVLIISYEALAVAPTTAAELFTWPGLTCQRSGFGCPAMGFGCQGSGSGQNNQVSVEGSGFG